jgi:rhodanese-related sulfurtransferase
MRECEIELETIEREDLAARLDRICPNNEDRELGFALVNVAESCDFELERIPGSTNIPRGQEYAFEKRFAKSKEIILYCGSCECADSDRVARALVRRGFTNVRVYAAGLRDWRDSGRSVSGSGCSSTDASRNQPAGTGTSSIRKGR